MTSEPGSRLDERMLDALVDNDLSEAARRELLLRLEAEPDGWRRCALAFLEAQAWRAAVGELADTIGPRAEPPVAPITREPWGTDGPRAADSRRRLLRAVARAAAVLVAFALGWHLRGGPEGPSPPVPLAGPPPQSLAQETASPIEPGNRPGPQDDGAFDAPSTSRTLAARMPGADLRAELEARGYRMETRPAWLVSQADDPHQPARVVPLQQVQLRYVGHPVY